MYRMRVTQYGETALHLAAAAGQMDMVRRK